MGTTAWFTHILLIDDSQAMLDQVRDLLEAAGYRVSISHTVPALTLVADPSPQLIVQDLRVADQAEAAWDFLTLVELRPDLASIPVILCTAEADAVGNPEMAANLDRLGLWVVLKPFSADDLLTICWRRWRRPWGRSDCSIRHGTRSGGRYGAIHLAGTPKGPRHDDRAVGCRAHWRSVVGPPDTSGTLSVQSSSSPSSPSSAATRADTAALIAARSRRNSVLWAAVSVSS